MFILFIVFIIIYGMQLFITIVMSLVTIQWKEEGGNIKGEFLNTKSRIYKCLFIPYWPMYYFIRYKIPKFIVGFKKIPDK